MIMRILDKVHRELYLLVHPALWFKKVQIQGIPKIGNIDRLVIGRDVTINDKVYIQCVGGVEIGDCCTISYGCTILSSGLKSEDYPNICMCKYREHILKSVSIGDGVWLGTGVKVMPGVTIAPKIIVGAGAVVTKDLNKVGWLYAGVPAKPIKPLIKK